MRASPQRSRRALTTTGLVLGLLVGPGVLAGCAGQESSGSAGSAESAGGEESSTASNPAGTIEFTEVALLSETAAGGQPGPAVELDGPGAVRDFTRQFDSTRLTSRVATEAARTDVPDGQVLLGAVLAVGCDEPSGIVGVTREGDEWTVEGAPYLGPAKQCFAAVTTVALVLVETG